MAKFTTQEVNALQEGGNEVFEHIVIIIDSNDFLVSWYCAILSFSILKMHNIF